MASWWVVNAGSSGRYKAEAAASAQAITDGLVVSGPYASQAQAQAHFPAATSPGPGSSGGAGGRAGSSSGSAGSSGGGGCGAQAIYNALLSAGFSTVQAIGAMANAINESSLNPEASALDSNGATSNGLWQFNEASYPDSGKLITGNCAADIVQQVGYLKAHISGNALNGSTGAEVASNFAASFEGCQGCQPGGSQNAQRVANAATVEGWISSGSWPTAAAGISGSGATLAASSGATLTGNTSRCLVGGGILPCLLDASQARALIGGACMLGAGLIATVGIVVLLVGVGTPVASKAASAVAPLMPPPLRVLHEGAIAHQHAGDVSHTHRLEAPAAPQQAQATVTRPPRQVIQGNQLMLEG